MYVYLSESEKFSQFNDPSALFWLEEELIYGDWTAGENSDGMLTHTASIALSEVRLSASHFMFVAYIFIQQNVQNNGSIFLHVFYVKAGDSPNPQDKERYSRKLTVHRFKQLNRYKKRRFHTMKNLLTGTSEAHPDLIRVSLELTFTL